MCPEPDGGIEARECEFLRQDLRSWGVNVVYDSGPNVVNTQSCIPEQVIEAANQPHNIRQRWSLGEMSAIHNAFGIFGLAHNRFRDWTVISDIFSERGGFNYDYQWPLAEPITIEKRRFAAWERAELTGYNVEDPASSVNPIGIHYYLGGSDETTRKIVLSGPRWGEANANMTRQSRSWIVLHEFAHIFSRDRLSARCGSYDGAERQLISAATLPLREGGLDFDLSGSPTLYSTFGVAGSAPPASFGQEYYTEAVTGVIWHYGWSSVTGYTLDAGGWYSTSVLDIIGNDGTRLFTWVMFNVIGLTSCPV